jgi:ParB-like chromosome segregation protein Spo0J
MASSIECWSLDRFIPYVRTHSDEQVAQIAASIKEFGFVNPILAGSDDSPRTRQIFLHCLK